MRQRTRFGGSCGLLNAQLTGGVLREHCSLDRLGAKLLDAAIQKFCLSGRGCDRVLRVARTVADLAGAESITAEHLAEALQYRIVE